MNRSTRGERAYTAMRDGARERVAAGVGRGDLHAGVVAVDEGDVVGDAVCSLRGASGQSCRRMRGTKDIYMVTDKVEFGSAVGSLAVPSRTTSGAGRRILVAARTLKSVIQREAGRRR